jgi:hypothetical protein
MLWENEYEYVTCDVESLFVYLSVRPPRLGVRPPFYRSRGRRVTCTPRYLATWGCTSRYAVEWAAVRTIFAAIWPWWPASYPNSGGSRVGGRQMVVASSDRLRGRCWRWLVRSTGVGRTAFLPNVLHSVGVVATAPGMRLHARGRRPCCYSGRDGDPPA